jgi:hypothetical protein
MTGILLGLQLVAIQDPAATTFRGSTQRFERFPAAYSAAGGTQVQLVEQWPKFIKENVSMLVGSTW